MLPRSQIVMERWATSTGAAVSLRESPERQLGDQHGAGFLQPGENRRVKIEDLIFKG